jgi:hypothetical protein
MRLAVSEQVVVDELAPVVRVDPTKSKWRLYANAVYCIDHERSLANLASFLLGTTDFLLALKTDPERMHRLLGLVTDFLVDWLAWQRECFPSIDEIRPSCSRRSRTRLVSSCPRPEACPRGLRPKTFAR